MEHEHERDKIYTGAMDDAPERRLMADRKITLTPPLTAVAQDAETMGLGFTALLTADVTRARALAHQAWQSLDLSDHVRHALLHVTEGIETGDIAAGIDDLPSVNRIYAEAIDAGYPREARVWLDAMPGPLAVWGLMMAARK